jgi:RHS repeat-associated protein
VTEIDWNPYGKVTTVTSPTGTTTFGYGPDQNRWMKDRGESGATYYVRDAQGSTLATYEADSLDAQLTWKQQYLFGSSRLGEVVFDRLIADTSANPYNYGERRYELTNHLGNVTTVFGENAVAYEDTEDGTTYTAPALVSYRDYMAFGLGLDRGSGVLGGEGYAYGFNSKELDDEGEWGSSASLYDYGFRIYNPQVGRFLSVDPMSREGADINPYNFVYNTPLILTDPNGLWPIYGTDGEYLGDDGQSAPGLDLAFTGKAAVDDQGNTVFTDLQQFTDNHTEFQTTANIVKHEGTTSDADEYLWIAHTANNAASSAGRTVHKQL